MAAQDFRPEEVKEKAQALKRASDRFQMLLAHRRKALLLVVEFFKEAEGLSQAVDVTAGMLPVATTTTTTTTTNGVLNPISVAAQLSFLQKRQKQLSLLAKQACEIIEETTHLDVDEADMQESQKAMQHLVQEISHKLEQYQLSQEDSIGGSEQTSLSQRDLEELESFLLDIEKHVEHQLQEQANTRQLSPSAADGSARKGSLPLVTRRTGCPGNLPFLPKQDSVQNLRQMFEMLSDSSLPSSPTTPSSLSNSERRSTYPPRKRRALVQDAAALRGIRKEDRTSSAPLITQAKIRTISSAHQISMVTVLASKEQSHAQSQPLTQSQPHVQSRPHARSQSPAQPDSEPLTKPPQQYQHDLLPVPSPGRAPATSVSRQKTSYAKLQGTGKVSQLRELFEAGSMEQIPVSPTRHKMPASPTHRKTPVPSPTHTKVPASPTHPKVPASPTHWKVPVSPTHPIIPAHSTWDKDVCEDHVRSSSPVKVGIHRVVSIRTDKQAIVTCEAPSRLTPVQVTIVDLEKGRVDTPPPKRPPTPDHLHESEKPPPIPPPPVEPETSEKEGEKDLEVKPVADIESEGTDSASQEEGEDNSSWDSDSSHNSKEEEVTEEQPANQLNITAMLTPVEEEEEEALTADSSLGDDQADVGLPWRKGKKAKQPSEDEQWKKRSLKSLR